MGTYCTATTLDTRMIGVTFDTATTNLVGELITDAENVINQSLSHRYNLQATAFQTTTAIPPMVRSLTLQLSEGYAWRALSRGSKESSARSEALIKGVTAFLQSLKDVDEQGNYRVNLLDTSGAKITDLVSPAIRNITIECNTKDYATTFNEDETTSWATDSDKLDDISSERD